MFNIFDKGFLHNRWCHQSKKVNRWWTLVSYSYKICADIVDIIIIKQMSRFSLLLCILFGNLRVFGQDIVMDWTEECNDILELP